MTCLCRYWEYHYFFIIWHIMRIGVGQIMHPKTVISSNWNALLILYRFILLLRTPWTPQKDHLEVPGPHFEKHWSDWLAGSASKRCAPNWLEPGRRIAFHTLLKYSPGRAWKGYCFPKCLILRSREGAAEWRRRVRDAVSKNPETSSRKKLTVRKAAPPSCSFSFPPLACCRSSPLLTKSPQWFCHNNRAASVKSNSARKNTNHCNAHKMRSVESCF